MCFYFYALICNVAKYEMDIFYRFIQLFSPYLYILVPIVLSKNFYIRYYCYLIIFTLVPIIYWYLLNKNNFLYYVFI